ncbi:MAG: (2Fe-2S)-binding protein [Ignavibacteriae bacterium]|nr:(2Fe-2S)-binding protein [Ignavibacteriota bacterium]MCB9206795.1 (2Fe-2S)-binding protein [Ignavibacteriales bacterium]MCB9259576.1 (2Fe-2S)-binding protein [Ignavibacteriales bacterium]
MSKKDEPANKSRRNFLKNISTGIVGAYTVSPIIKTNAQQLKKEFEDSLEGKVDLNLIINGKKVSKKIKPETTLAEFIRDDLNLTGTKLVCNQGECGSCTVLLNGEAIYSCHLLALDANDCEILTIEGLLKNEELHPIQQSFLDKDGLQCGFCTPGQIMTGYSILTKNPKATDEEIKKGMSGNLCRCAAYPKILDSVKAALNNKI